MICCIPKCGVDSGLHVICPFHRKTFRQLSDAMQRHVWTVLHVLVRGYDEMVKCFHCEKPFPYDQICADHFPLTKGADPANKFRPDRCVPSCAMCNTSGNVNRKNPNDYMHLLAN